MGDWVRVELLKLNDAGGEINNVEELYVVIIYSPRHNSLFLQPLVKERLHTRDYNYSQSKQLQYGDVLKYLVECKPVSKNVAWNVKNSHGVAVQSDVWRALPKDIAKLAAIKAIDYASTTAEVAYTRISSCCKPSGSGRNEYVEVGHIR